ncbi:MAG TPA: metallopeptidase family protein [Planctomycetota bacterium]|nr:metallopeptidase family protein [Planctomycetota bacterium]
MDDATGGAGSAAGRLSAAEFRAVVVETLKSLPAEFQPYLKNCSVLIEPVPPPEVLAEIELDPDDVLYGLYLGVPLTERGHGSEPVLPDRIYIFSEPLMEDCETVEDLREEIAITVVHELAHHFGFDEDLLERLGYG